jgi:lysozyme
MKTSEQGINLIKHFEGMRLDPYLCPAGVWTQGIGRTAGITANSPSISEETAEEWLREDLKRFEASVCRLIKQPLSQGQFDALVSFTFNLGGGALQRSTLRQKVNRGDFDGAHKEFYKWVRAGGRVLQGLVLRRSAEANLFQGE